MVEHHLEAVLRIHGMESACGMIIISSALDDTVRRIS